MTQFFIILGDILKLFPDPSNSYEEIYGSDEDQIMSDWEIVGNDLRKSMEKASDEHKIKKAA